MNGYDDFYYEPSEFEMQLDEFKESLLKSVKEEYVNEMERLRKENAELQIVKNDFKNIQSEYARKHRQLENERDSLERNIRKERLNKLLEGFQTTLYRADYKHEYPPKCDKCDEDRKVSYITPLGKNAEEWCDCKISTKIYFPEEYHCVDLSLYRDGSKFSGAYRQRSENSCSKSVDENEIYQTGTPFEELPEHWHTYFRSKDDCQAYCDWLTVKEHPHDQ